MAITQNVGIVIRIQGDGVSTTTDIDLYDYIKDLSVLPKTPSVVQAVSVDNGGPSVTAILKGAIISLTFASALLSTSVYNLTITLGF